MGKPQTGKVLLEQPVMARAVYSLISLGVIADQVQKIVRVAQRAQPLPGVPHAGKGAGRAACLIEPHEMTHAGHTQP